MMAKCALLLLTSHASLGNTSRGTGFYYDEMAVPYWTIRDLGQDVSLATVAGEARLTYPKTLVEPSKRPLNVSLFMDDDDTLEMDALQITAKASKIKGSDYHRVFLPSSNAPMWDFDNNPISDIVTEAWAAGVIASPVYHGPAELLKAKEINGKLLIYNKRFTSFTNRETGPIELIGVEPFLLETRLRDAGALFQCSDKFKSHAVKDGQLNYLTNSAIH